MALTIIVKDGLPRGRTRTQTDRELQDAGWGSSFKTDEDADKCAFVERKLKAVLNADDSQVSASLFRRVLVEKR